MTDQEVLRRLKRRQRQRERRYYKRGGVHAPRYPYDCARCKFQWCCGELCQCNIREGETPKARKEEVEMLLTTWRRTRPL